MRRFTYLSIIGVTAVLGGVAAPALAADCATAQFSDQVLARFPNIRLGCSEISEKDGQQYAGVSGDLVRTGTNAGYRTCKLADGTGCDSGESESFLKLVTEAGGTAEALDEISGLNYSRGRPTRITLYRVVPRAP